MRLCQFFGRDVAGDGAFAAVVGAVAACSAADGKDVCVCVRAERLPLW